VLQRETAAIGITVVGSLLRQLRSAGVRRVSVFTPYEEDLTRSVAACLSEGGFVVTSAAGMGLRRNLDIGNVSPSQIASFVREGGPGTPPDCLLLSCTNWRALEACAEIQARLGIPVITSNQACIAEVSRIIKEPTTESGPAQS
jgi:maleate isomerase